MKSNTALAFYYTKYNKNSINVLVGALENKSYFDNLDIYFINEKENLLSRLADILQKHEKVVLGFSFCTPNIIEISKLVKKLGKFRNKLILIAGGPHPIGDPKGTLTMGFDIVVIGEGEDSLAKLLIAIDTGKPRANIIRSKKSINLANYPPFAVKHRKFNQIEITRGCSYGCKFCQATFLYNAPLRHRSISEVCKYIKIMLENNLKDIRFITPNAFSYGSKTGRDMNLNAVEQLLKSIRQIVGKKGRIFFGTFPSEVRPEFVTESTLELLKKYTDNNNIVIGAQSGSNKVLKACNRGHAVEDIYRAVELATKAGLKANVDFMFGLPGETEEDIEQTFKVIEDLATMGARIHGHTFMPLAGTPYQNEQSGKLSKKTLKKLELLVSKGILYGEWRKQARLAKVITKYKSKTL